MRPLPLVTALTLCALAWLLAWSTGALSPSASRSSTTEATDTVPITLDPAAVTTLEARLEEATITARRADLPVARWVVSDGPSTWPADEATLRDTLRALTTAQLRPGTASATPTTSSLTASTPDASVALRLAPTPTGGLLPGTLSTGATDTPVLAPASLADLARVASNGAWRSPALLPRIEPGPSQLAISTPQGTGVTLLRRSGRWSFAGSPARVDEGAANDLIARLLSLRAANWMRDDQEMATPVVTITLTTTRPPDRSWTQTLEILGQADLAGQLIAVRSTLRSDNETWSVRAAVPATALAGLPASTIPLTDPRSLPAPAADVVRVDYRGRSFTRDQRRWRTGEGTLLPDSEAQALEAFLALLAKPDANILSEVPPTNPTTPTDPGPLLLWLAGDPEPRAYRVTQEPGRLIVTENKTARAYPGVRAWQP